MPRLLITYKEPMSKETIGRWRRVIWLYRIAWLVGIGYLVNTYILSDSPNSKGHAIFDAPRFVPLSIVAREDVSPTSFILTLRPSHGVKPGVDPYADEWDKGTWSVEFKQPQLQIARSYTPLPPNSDVQDPGDLRFLIRKERGGEVSNYLARLPVGGKVEIRGPHPEIDLPKDLTDVVFLAGGTGIAPAMQVAYTLLDKRTGGERPRIHIVWANRKREDCVGGMGSSFAGSLTEDPLQSTGTIVRELQMMQNSHPGHLSVDYLVDEEGTFLDQTKISALTTGISQSSASAGSKLIFVSGPEGFINVLAGPKKWEDGEEKQGEVGGVIGQMGVTDWKVWKL
jgi:cytochrome-b5 reductase